MTLMLLTLEDNILNVTFVNAWDVNLISTHQDNDIAKIKGLMLLPFNPFDRHNLLKCSKLYVLVSLAYKIHESVIVWS